MSRPDYAAPRMAPARRGFSEVVDELSQVVRVLADCGDVSQLIAVLQEYLNCEVELLFAPAEGEVSRGAPDVLRSGDSYWMSVPLLFDRTRLGWLRARSEALGASGINVLTVAGRIASCLLWEQARAHRAWAALLTGAPISQPELMTAARECGLADGTPCTVMACQISPDLTSDRPVRTCVPGQTDGTWFKCWLKLDRPAGLQPLCFARGQRLAIFLPLDPAEAARAPQALTALARSVQRAFGLQHDGSCAIGIGGLSAEVAQLPRLWRDAVRALDLGTALGGRAAVSDVDSLGIMGLVLEHVPTDALCTTCRRMLSPLLEHDAQKGTDFCRTLRVFLDADCRFAEAARILYVHENTLRHRVKRIEEAMDTTLADPYTRANLYLGLKLMDLGLRPADPDATAGAAGGLHP